MHTVTPHTRCRLKVLKMERILDFLKMEEELIQNMERLRPQEQKEEVNVHVHCVLHVMKGIRIRISALNRSDLPVLPEPLKAHAKCVVYTTHYIARDSATFMPVTKKAAKLKVTTTFLMQPAFKTDMP